MKRFALPSINTCISLKYGLYSEGDITYESYGRTKNIFLYFYCYDPSSYFYQGQLFVKV